MSDTPSLSHEVQSQLTRALADIYLLEAMVEHPEKLTPELLAFHLQRSRETLTSLSQQLRQIL